MSEIDPQTVTWVRIEQPIFDLWGVITSSLTFALVCVAVSAALGGLVAWVRIRRQRSIADDGSLLSEMGHRAAPISQS